jgi:hypothetical protein
MTVFSAMDMGTRGSSGGVSSADLANLKFVPLHEGQGIYEAKVFGDELDAQGNPKITYDVKEISFGGNAKLGGIKSENDFSVIDLDLANIKEIQIVNPAFKSQRHKIENEFETFILATITFDKGAPVENILIPRKVQISAVEINTSVGKAWMLANLSKIEIKKSTVASQDAVNTVNQAFKESNDKSVAIKTTPGHKVVRRGK